MNKNPITVEEVRSAIVNLRARDEKPTIEKLRQEIGRGSLTTLLRFRNEILEPETANIESNSEAVGAFRQIWQSAVEIGRKGEVARSAEARAEVEALSREAERFENECSLLQNQLGETRNALDRALDEATVARKESKEAFAAVAIEQAKATQGVQEKSELLRQLADL